jgi:hypothetical protein
MFARTALLVATIGAAMVIATGTAAASTGPLYYSPDQAGYAATGAHFKVAEVHVTLPYASRFARELGRVGLGVQLWSTATVLDLRLSACTDYTCKPGGPPVTRRYRPVLRVFSRSTGSLICSTLNDTCPDIPSSWKNARFAPGKSVDMALVYEPDIGGVDASVEAGSSGADYPNYFLDPGLVFNQARIGAEFGLTPWSTVPFRHPSSQMRLATFWEPSTAPFEAELATYGGSSGCFASWWTRHVIKMTSDGTSSGTLEARPGGLWNNGCDFRVYLEP